VKHAFETVNLDKIPPFLCYKFCV